MRQEADEMPNLRMRLMKTRGSTYYDEEYHEHYTRYPRHLLGPSGEMVSGSQSRIVGVGDFSL